MRKPLTCCPSFRTRALRVCTKAGLPYPLARAIRMVTFPDGGTVKVLETLLARDGTMSQPQ